ncbi:MAG: sulfatase [Opitutae bacterium]|nr:sulfatase [Opitutae bacterium]
MRIHLLFLFSLSLAFGTFAKNKKSKPNVILFLIDDLGWSDIGVNGSTFYETPVIDQMAKDGALFTDAYAASPVCSPSRASILTGKYPSRINVSYISGTTGPKGIGYKLTAPQPDGFIAFDETSIAEALRKHDYKTVHIGKWHLQNHTDRGTSHFPENHGFDLNIAGFRMGQPGSYYFPFKSERHPSTNVPGLEDGKQGDYLTDTLTDKAISFIKQNKEQPFFINFWYYTVHTPIQPKKDKLEKYQKKAEALGYTQKHQDGIPVWNSITRKRQDSPAYACMVESMDENIGRVLQTLKSQKLEQDTLVIFFSDNGGLCTGSGPNMPTSGLPLRAGKAWLYEGGIRVPLIIKFPGKIKAGTKISEPVVGTDIYPTILDLLGLPLTPEQHLDGESLNPLLTGKNSFNREAIYFHFPHYHHINSMGPSGAIRKGDFKLIEVFETGNYELYNVRKDIGEDHDLAPKMPKLVRELASDLKTWRKTSNARIAVLNQQYDPSSDFRNKKK